MKTQSVHPREEDLEPIERWTPARRPRRIVGPITQADLPDGSEWHTFRAYYKGRILEFAMLQTKKRRTYFRQTERVHVIPSA